MCTQESFVVWWLQCLFFSWANMSAPKRRSHTVGNTSHNENSHENRLRNNKFWDYETMITVKLNHTQDYLTGLVMKKKKLVHEHRDIAKTSSPNLDRPYRENIQSQPKSGASPPVGGGSKSIVKFPVLTYAMSSSAYRIIRSAVPLPISSQSERFSTDIRASWSMVR